MSHLPLRAAALAALLLAAACAERPSPLEPHSRAGVSGTPSMSAQAASPEQGRHERLARAFALALRDGDFRAAVFQALQQSRIREGKVHLQLLLASEGGKLRRRLAELAETAEATAAEDLDQAAPIEIYLPVPTHRKAWRGDPQVLVATAEGDHDTPVAFDIKGRRQLLDPERPPAVPVIALGRAELSFALGGPLGLSCPDCGLDDGIIGGGGGTVAASTGLYMTYAKFNSTFEGWLKGAPEFETHILGQDGGSNTMKSYQCAGESAGTPYRYNQDEKEWGGSVMLFSQAQLDAYQAAHPGQALRILVIEDDDDRCVIKTDSTRVKKMLEALATAYGLYTGGKDTQIFSVKTFKNAFTLFNIFKSVWSFFQTQDDVVGFAIEDVIAREYFPGANWIVKGENTATNGAIRLEMR